MPRPAAFSKSSLSLGEIAIETSSPKKILVPRKWHKNMKSQTTITCMLLLGILIVSPVNGEGPSNGSFTGGHRKLLQQCSASASCAGGLCCSKWGWCGSSAAHCGAECIRDCWVATLYADADFQGQSFGVPYEGLRQCKTLHSFHDVTSSLKIRWRSNLKLLVFFEHGDCKGNYYQYLPATTSVSKVWDFANDRISSYILLDTECGDGVCDHPEDQDNCPWDCGIRPPTSSTPLPFLSKSAGLLYEQPMPDNGKTWIRPFEGKVGGKHLPSSDGCTINPVNYKEEITPSCYAHDFCWTCGGWWGATKSQCNNVFQSTCKASCDYIYRNSWWDRNFCKDNCNIVKIGVDAAIVFNDGLAGRCGQIGNLPQNVRDSLRFLTRTAHIYGECERNQINAPKVC